MEKNLSSMIRTIAGTVMLLVLSATTTALFLFYGKGIYPIYTGSHSADLLVGVSYSIVLLAVVYCAIRGILLRLLFARDDEETFSIAISIGVPGFAIVRGIIQHWAWWINHWDQARIIRDLILGTIRYFFVGLLSGWLVSVVVMLMVWVVWYPILYLIARIMKFFSLAARPR